MMLQPNPSPKSQLVKRSLEAELEVATKSGEIQLQCKNLTEFPRSLGKHFVLADTRLADLSRNKLAEVPEECTYFPSLEKLILYHNSIKSIPDSLRCLQSLQFLDLSRNQLTYIPSCVCQLSQLQSLVINNNKLVSLPEEIGELTNLMQLDVSCNEIAHLPVQIGDLANLRTLNLRRNHLQEVPVELTYLQLNTLELSSNRLTNLPVELRFMVTLVELHLEENPLSCPPANMCCRGRVHIFKYLETIAIKEDKKRGILADTEHRRSYRKTSQIGDMRFGGMSGDARLKRHTADSGYGSEQPNVGARRWSTDLQDGPDTHAAEDTRRLAHRAISYRPAVHPAGFSGGTAPAPPPALSPKPSINVQMAVAHPSLSSNGSGSSGVSSLSSQGGVSPGGPAATESGKARLSKDVCDSPKWSQPAINTSRQPDNNAVAKTKFGINGDSRRPQASRTNGTLERKESCTSATAASQSGCNGAAGLRIGTGLRPESRNNRDLSLDNLEKKKLNGNVVEADKSKKSILKTHRANSNSSLTGKLPVPNQVTSPRHSPTSPTPSGHSSPNSNKSFGPIPSNPNNSGLPSPTLVTGVQTKSSNFQTYRQFKEQQKLNRQTDSAYRPDQKLQRNNHKTGVEIRSYYERMQSQTSVLRAGAPPETSPPPPPSQVKPPISRTAIPTANRSPSNASTGSYNRAQPGGPRVNQSLDKSQFTVRRESERAAVHDMHIHHLRQSIEQRLKISLGDDLPGCLADGVVLCHMANHVSPRSVNSIHVPSPAVPKLSAAKCRRNVDNFVAACRKIGVREDLICNATDITEPNSNHTVRVAVTVAELLRYKNI